MTKLYTIGIVGLGVMGDNLGRNFHNKGISVIGYDIDVKKVTKINSEDFLDFTATNSLEEFVGKLERPQKIIVLIPDNRVNSFLEELIKCVDDHAIVMDLSNAHYKKSFYRQMFLMKNNINYLGIGISGGAQGAKTGASFMVGGDYGSFVKVKHLIESVAATENKIRCVGYFGAVGSGHYVKMVHNGVEYALMAMISEVYSFLKQKYQNKEIAEIFARWSCTKLNSYLLKISEVILRKKNNAGYSLIDLIKGKVLQKGTGVWTIVESLNMGLNANILTQAVFTRFISNDSKMKDFPCIEPINEILFLVDFNALESAILLVQSAIIYQGLKIIERAFKVHGWVYDLNEILKTWVNGSIVQSQLIRDIFLGQLELNRIIDIDLKSLTDLKNITKTMIDCSVYCPTFCTTLNYCLTFVSDSLGTNIVAAQRDYFGSHGVYLSDDSELTHIEW